MAVELYDIDAVKSQLGEVLDDFITDVRSAPPFVTYDVCCQSTHDLSLSLVSVPFFPFLCGLYISFLFYLLFTL